MAVTALLILDGFGIGGNDPKSNAILAAGTPNIDRLKAEYCSTAIGASGLDVGLPDGQMGNSEVGHTNIGAGRVVYQMLVKITKDIEDGVFFENKALLAAMENCKQHDSALHLMGLVSPGGVHSHTDHLYGLLEMAKRHGLSKVYVHCFLDGRDVPPDSGWEYVQELVAKMNEIGVGKIATVMGRLYAMDRDNAWERIEQAYDAMVFGQGIQASDPVQAIRDSYQVVDETGKHLTDEFVLPTVIDKDGVVKANDSVVFFNFRPDRAREITRAFVDPDFKGFASQERLLPAYVCVHDAVRRDDAQRARRLSAGVFAHDDGRVPFQDGQDAAAHRRDAEVRPRDVLLQRRRGARLPRRGPHPHPLPARRGGADV